MKASEIISGVPYFSYNDSQYTLAKIRVDKPPQGTEPPTQTSPKKAAFRESKFHLSSPVATVKQTDTWEMDVDRYLERLKNTRSCDEWPECGE